MGVLYVLLVERELLPATARAVLMVGLLGAFTTFSTFSLETVHLLERGELFRAISNVAASAVLCVLACGIGVQISRQF